MSCKTTNSPGDAGTRWIVHKLSSAKREERRGQSATADRSWGFLSKLQRVHWIAEEFESLVGGLYTDEVRDCLAYAWGFESLHDLEQAAPLRTAAMKKYAVGQIMGGRDPENDLLCYDEFLPPAALEARRRYQARRFHEWLDLDLQDARALVEALRPSAMVRRPCENRPLTQDSWRREDHEHQVAEEALALNPLDRRWVFIPPPGIFGKRKRQDLQLLMRSLSVETAKRCLAFILGHRNAKALERVSVASFSDLVHYTYDEDLTLADLLERRAFQVARAMMFLSLDEQSSRALIDRLRPSARQRLFIRGFESAAAQGLEEEHDAETWRRLNQRP